MNYFCIRSDRFFYYFRIRNISRSNAVGYSESEQEEDAAGQAAILVCAGNKLFGGVLLFPPAKKAVIYALFYADVTQQLPFFKSKSPRQAWFFAATIAGEPIRYDELDTGTFYRKSRE